MVCISVTTIEPTTLLRIICPFSSGSHHNAGHPENRGQRGKRAGAAAAGYAVARPVFDNDRLGGGIEDIACGDLGFNDDNRAARYDGRITIPGLEPGTTITARETRTLPGFILDTAPQTIQIKVGPAGTLVSTTTTVLPGMRPVTVTVPSLPVV